VTPTEQPWMTSFEQVENAAYIAEQRRDAVIVLAQLPVFKGSHLLYMYQLVVNSKTAFLSRIV
jgi:hypothetical protein